MALDDFKHNQSGLPWQRVALQLLRPSFPHLVAHHITSDQGADAISYANDSNGETVAFGCSITCIRTKIRDDCQEIERSGKKVHRFIFATSVSKTKVELAPWIMGLESQFKIRIDVLEREHFVQLLLRPENHWICRDYLHIPIGDGTSHDEKFAAASLANRVRWRKQNEIYQDQLIDLRYFIGDDEPIDLERLVELVKARVDIILTGSPGAGKNVSLAQLAERLVDGPVTPFIVSLDGWAESKKTLPDYVASQPECSLAGVKAAFIRTAVIEKRVVFLLNGWNEIGAAELARAYRCLREERAAMQGISVVLATRPSSLLPPLPGSAEIRVAGLSRRQRREFIEKYRADSSIENRLDTDPVLDEISRTPLFLRAILAHASSGKPIPRTRHGIIELLMINLEQQPDHASHWISSAIAGHQRSYLQLLADHMTHAGKSNTTQAAGLSVIGDCTNRLRKNVGLHGSPKPQHILNERADHHVLRRRSSKPPSFAFSHQQIQEWFASHALHDDLVSIAASNEPNDFARFKSDVINRPNMEQSILFLVDRLNDDIGAENQIPTALNEARCLLAMAIEVDPLFAAKLVGYFESSVWSNVKGIFAKKLRAWHNSESEVQRKLATTAMLLTRSGDFSDIVVPLVEGENQAVRLDTYRLVEPFPLTTLGSDWQRRIDNWPEDRRGELIRELTSNDVGLEGIDLALKWIKTDTSPKIAAQGLELLVWIQAGPALVEALSNASYEILIEAAEQAVFDFLELDDLHRVRARLHELLNLKSGLVPDTVVWRTVHALVRLDDPLVKDKAVKLLRNDGAYALQADVVAYLKKHSPKALTCWLLDQMSNQNL